MIDTRIVYKITDAHGRTPDVVRTVGPKDGAWNVFVLNGHGRSFEARSGGGSFSIKWMADGRARYGLDRRSRTVSRQAAVLVDHGQPYEMEFEARSGAQSFCLFYSRELLSQAWASVEAGLEGDPGEGALRAFPNVVFRPSPRLGGLLGDLHGQGPDIDETVLESRALLALAEAVTTAHRHRREARAVPAAKPATRAHLLAQVERARQRLADCEGVGCSLEVLALETGVSRFHLLRLFKAVLGVTPMAYAERLRMQAAAARLRSSGRAIGEVAAELGYDSPSAFAKAFRRWTGAAPTAWRT